MVRPTLANCSLIVVERWPTIRNVRLAVALAKELFSNKGPTVFVPSSAQNPAHIGGISTPTQQFANPTIPNPIH